VGNSGISSADLAVIGSYVLMMLGIGYYVYRRAPSFQEFALSTRLRMAKFSSLPEILERNYGRSAGIYSCA
jgi:hypothetical protein